MNTKFIIIIISLLTLLCIDNFASEPGNKNAFTVVDAPLIYKDSKRLAKAASSLFVIQFSSDFPDSAQKAFTEACKIWSYLITSPRTINVKAVWKDMNKDNILAGFVPKTYYNIPSAQSGNPLQPFTQYVMPLAEALTKQDLNGVNDPDIEIEVNSDFKNKFSYSLEGVLVANKYDFISIIMHEIGHGLGIGSSMDFNNGIGSYGMTGFPTDVTGNYPTLFDPQIRVGQNKTGNTLINSNLYPNNSTQLGEQLVSDNLYYYGAKTYLLNGNILPKLFVPKVWEDGSSVHHLDDSLYPAGNSNALMTHEYDMAEFCHSPGTIGLAMLEDLGWTTNRLITVMEPKSNAVWKRGTTVKIKWVDNQYGGIVINLYKKGMDSTYSFYLTINTHTNYEGVDSCYWDVPLTFANGDYKVVFLDPNSNTGYGESYRITISDQTRLAMPEITPKTQAYTTTDPIQVSIKHADSTVTIRYTVNGYAPDLNSKIYTVPFNVNPPATVQAKAFKDGGYLESYNATERYSYEAGIKITQVDESGNTINKKMYVWVEANSYPNPFWLDFDPNTVWKKSNPMAFKAYEDVLPGTTQRYNIWDDNRGRRYSRNWEDFNTTEISQLTAHFAPSYNAVIQYALEGIPVNTSNQIYFKDPWLRNDNSNTRLGVRNKGDLAGLLSYNTPLNLSPSNGNLGVFKNIRVSNPGFTYSAKALPNQTIDSKLCYFSNWFAQGAELTTPNSEETPIVFTEDNAKVYANYKGHLVSNNKNATAGSSGRKISVCNGVTHAVYTSMGYVWYTHNTGSGWSNEVKIGEGKNPSIHAAGGQEVYITWETDYGYDATSYVLYRKSIDFGITWSSEVILDEITVPNEAVPVVAGLSSAEHPIVYIWHSPEGLKMFNTYEKKLISGTKPESKQPSIAENCFGYHLVYTDGNQIYYKNFNLRGNEVLLDAAPVQLSDANLASYNVNPTVTCGNVCSVTDPLSNLVCVAWEGKYANSYNKVFYKEKRNTDSWSAIVPMSHGSYVISKPSLCLDSQSKTVSLIWQCDGGVSGKDLLGKISRDVSNTSAANGWSSVISLGQGNGPGLPSNLSSGTPLTAMYLAGSSAPYNVKFPVFHTIPATTLQDANTTWDGFYSVTGNVTVPLDKTLTIQEGSTINFINKSQLTVTGTLNIQGTSTSNVVLDFIAPSTSPINCIWANSKSHININYAEIKNGGLGIWANDAEVHIDNSNFHNMIRPVYFFNQVSNSYGSTIKNSIFDNSTAEGIWFRNSSDYLENNKITNTVAEALRVSDHSSPTLNKNTMQNCRNGITARLSCIPKLLYNNLIKDHKGMGIYAWSYSGVNATNGNNSIQTTTGYHIYVESYSYANVDHTYWGEYPPNNSKFYNDPTSSISYYDYLQSDPGTGSDLLKTTQPTDDLELAYSEMAQDNYDNAEKLLKKIIVDKFDEKESRFALSALASCYIKNNKSGFRKYLVNSIKNRIKDTKNDLYRLFLELNSYFSVQEGNYDESLSNIKSLRNNFTLDAESKKDLDFREGMINLVFKENIDIAKSIFEKIKGEHPDTMTRFDIDIVLQAYENGAFANIRDIQYKLNQEQKVGKTEEELPANFGLDQNYPNPFNPMTSIKYALPQNSRVTLEVYSILGEKVASLVDDVKSAGYHEAVFDGSNLSSGIYIYRLTANSLVTGERFVKSAKMMLVK